MSTTCCLNCGKESNSFRSCATCKEAKYCSDVCGAEHWERHYLECNYVTAPVHIDWVMAPEGYEMGSEHPEYVIECPNEEGTELVEYKMSEIGRKFGSSEEGQFFGSKEGIPPGGVDLDHSLDAIGDEYILQIGVKNLNGDLIDSVQVRGSLKSDIKVRKFQSRSGQEVVLMPDLASMVKQQSSRNPIRIPSADSQPHIIEFQLLQAKTKGTEEVRKEVFTTNGVMLPDKFFARTNKYGGLRTAQSFGSRKADSYLSARERGAGRRRSFLTALTTRVGAASKFYKGKMKALGQDVKVAIILTKDDNASTATMEEVYFKIHPSLFEGGDWYNPSGADEGSSAGSSSVSVNANGLGAPIRESLDAYDLEGVTALCWQLETHIAGIGELLKDEDDDRYILDYRKQASLAKRYLNSLKPHQVALQEGIDDEYDAPSQVNAAIRGAMQMESIDALFKKRADREKNKWKKANKNASVGELMAMAEALILVLNPPAPGDSKWEKVKGATAQLYRKFKGQRGKAKGRLRGTVELIRKKKTEAPSDQQDEIQDLLNRAAAAQV